MTKLSKRQTVLHFKESLQSASAWTKSNVYMNKILGHRPMMSKHTVFAARREEEMKTGKYPPVEFEIGRSQEIPAGGYYCCVT